VHVFRECKHIKNIFEDVYFTKNILDSNHYLEIERGRHRGLQAKEGICKLHVCLKEVEDEIHFLLKCEALQNVRTPVICSLQILSFT
jgi:hypothetical protein